MSPTPTSSTVVNLSSDNAAVTLPASVVVPANTRSVQFPVVVSAVTTAQVADLTASSGGDNTTYTLNLQAATRILVVTTSSVAFPSAMVSTSSAPMAVAVHSSGSMPVTVNATVTGSAFSIVNTALPMIVAPYSDATMYVQFSPATATALSGALTITNNGTGSSGLSASVPLTGLGTPVGAFPDTQVASILLPNPNALNYVPSSFFGMTIYNLASNSSSATSSLTPFPSFKVSTLRLWDVSYWAGIEPTQG